MYVHLGNEGMIWSEDIIGIFDIENTTVSRDSREFLSAAAARKCETAISSDMPASFVVSKGMWGEKVFISSLSSAALIKRCRKNKY